MKKLASGWICLFACLFYVMELSVLPVCGAEPKTAQRTRAGGDAGEAVPQDSGKESSAWAWVLGAGAAVAAGVVGFLLSGDAKDEKSAAKDAAAEADASAAAAEANAAADAAAAPEASVTIFIRGTFTTTVTAPRVPGPGTFTPSITFSVSDLVTYPGGISGYTSSQTGAPVAVGGKVEQNGSKTLFIWTDDGFYNGVATVVDDHTLRLEENGYVLTGPSRAIMFK